MIRALSSMWSTTVAVFRTDWWVALLAVLLWGLTVFASHHDLHFLAGSLGITSGIMVSIVLDDAWHESKRRGRDDA